MKPTATQTSKVHDTQELKTTCIVDEKHEDDSDSDNDIDYKQSAN